MPLFTLKPLTARRVPEAGLASWIMVKEKQMCEDWNTWKAAAPWRTEGGGGLEIAMILPQPSYPCMASFVEAFKK